MRKGFTILELLIVIAVIAILVAIALPRFRGMREEGLIAQAKGELRSLQTAVESYYIHGRVYPGSATWPADIENATPNIIGTDSPKDAFSTSNDYGYAVSTNGNYYVIYSRGTSGSATATIANDGTVTETATTCIYVTNAGRDTTP
jgi:prepilin-type N-terminal cleavage/methylation domain-containing protein